MNEANQKLLEGRVAVVTGSGRGIGRAHALRMAGYGARVVVNDLGVAIDGKPTSETPADEVVGEIRAAGGEAVADRSDISTVAGGTAVVLRAIETWGRLGIAAFTAAVAQEMEPYLVTVNAIMPGARTRMASVGWRMDRLEGDAESRDPVHVAELVCYLASPSAGWISGQLFHVSGHRIAHAIPWTDRAELRRSDRGWNALDLVREFPRFFGAGPRPNEMPPKEWAERRAGGGGLERK